MPLPSAIQELLNNNRITQQQAEDLTPGARLALQNDGVLELITARRLTMEQALGLTRRASLALLDDGVRELITAGRLPMARVLGLNYASRDALLNPGVRALITAGTLTARDLAGIRTWAASYALRDAGVLELITARRLTMAQVLALTDAASAALRDVETQQRLRDGEITVEDILGLDIVPQVFVPNINEAQSTHNASVHKAASTSAGRLADCYKLIIYDEVSLESVIDRVKAHVGGLPDSPKNKAAKTCILRLTAPDYDFTDPDSKVTMRHLIALTFLVMEGKNLQQDEDKKSESDSPEDARALFVEGLYEIQRGYNLSDTGVDQGGDDGPICAGGTFNKFIEKLQGIHPDCEILFITRGGLSLKLPIVVKEEAMGYMKSLASPNTLEELQAFTRLISEIKEEGLDVIWEHIREKIADRMFDEYGSLYEDRADQSFTASIDAGQFIGLPDLSVFQEQIQNSKGYHQYGSQVLRRSGMFSSPEKSADDLSERRHDNPETQRAYDQQFGLVLRK